MKIKFCGATTGVTGSCHLISTENHKVLLDCGQYQGGKAQEELNFEDFPFDPSEIEYLVLSHAHIDHCGRIPLLVKRGFKGQIYCTDATADLLEIMLKDSGHIHEQDAEWQNRKNERAGRPLIEPLYTERDAEESLKYIKPVLYDQLIELNDEMRIVFNDAGHILGSAISHFHIGDGLHNVVFTGDFKYEKTRLFDPAVNKFPRVESVIMESTYGGANALQPSLQDAENHLQQVIKNTLQNKGIVLIPAFAVGRSQEVMIVLEDAIRKGLIDNVPVYLDGMIWEATAIHATYPEYLNNDLRRLIFQKGENPFLSECFKPVDSNELRQEIISKREPCVILSTSGMMNAGPVMEYFKAFAEDERNTLVFVGYQADGTLGRRIQKGWKEIPLNTGKGTEVINMNMNVEIVDGFSGHSDRRQLMEYVRKMKPRPERVFTEHGDERSCIDLATSIHKKNKMETRALTNLETIRLV